MFRMMGTALLGLILTGTATTGWCQEPPAQKGTAPAGGRAPGTVAALPGANDVYGTVTSRGQTDKITKADVVNILSQYPVPVEERENAYKTAMDIIAGKLLMAHYLVAQQMVVPESKIDEQVEQLRQQLKKQGQDLPTMLLQNGSSMEDVRKDIATQFRFDELVRTRATDAALHRFIDENHDRYAGTMIRASHIMLQVKPGATKEQKDQIRQKLEAIRKEIVSGRITFAAAANKYSEDPANQGGAGGDLDYFKLDGGFVDEFAQPAFKLGKGKVSEPIETPYGFHLIMVTDRKEGKLPDFEQNRPLFVQQFRRHLQDEIVAEEKKAAKIDIKPMPKDLYPSEPPAATGQPAPAASPAPGAAAAKPKP